MTHFTLNARLAADTLIVTELQLCQVLLMNDRRFPWLILVPRQPDLTEIIDLQQDDQTQLWHEIALCSEVLKQVAEPHKLNIGALGNVVSQLHIHIIARQVDDAAWPDPVWGKPGALPWHTADATAIIKDIQQEITTRQ